MTEADPKSLKEARLRALSRWESEGGAPSGGAEPPAAHRLSGPHFKKTEGAELTNLHVRIMALENLVISLLATATDQQLHLAREMADYISPREGFTPHPMTTRAAADMVDLIERAARFRAEDAADPPPHG